ncbi:MAG: metal-dependent hydrolase [Pseudomonadota bacterium]
MAKKIFNMEHNGAVQGNRLRPRRCFAGIGRRRCLMLGNHLISGIVMTEFYLALTGYLWRFQEFVQSETLFYQLPCIAAIFLGSVFSDIDIKLNIPKFHRTLTHWPYLYIVMMVFWICFYQDRNGAMDPVAFSFSMSCLVHIYMDYNTMTGVPLGLNPFGRKYSSRKIAVGSSGELIVTIIMLLIAICIYWVPLIFMEIV